MSDGNTMWTTKAPDRAGWWWFRCSSNDYHKRYLVELYESDEGLRFASDAELVSFVCEQQHPACQWSDRPILPPQEPDKP